MMLITIFILIFTSISTLKFEKNVQNNLSNDIYISFKNEDKLPISNTTLVISSGNLIGLSFLPQNYQQKFRKRQQYFITNYQNQKTFFLPLLSVTKVVNNKPLNELLFNYSIPNERIISIRNIPKKIKRFIKKKIKKAILSNGKSEQYLKTEIEQKEEIIMSINEIEKKIAKIKLKKNESILKTKRKLFKKIIMELIQKKKNYRRLLNIKNIEINKFLRKKVEERQLTFIEIT